MQLSLNLHLSFEMPVTQRSDRLSNPFTGDDGFSGQRQFASPKFGQSDPARISDRYKILDFLVHPIAATGIQWTFSRIID